MKKIIIKKENAGGRLDKFLVKEFFSLGMTRGEIIRNINSGNILVNNKQVKPSYLLKEREEIKINIKKEKTEVVSSKKIKLEIIYQDKNIIVIDKPAGISVHPTKPNEKNTLVNFLVYKFPEIKNIHDTTKNSFLRPGIVHRLDKDTSGVMVAARNKKIFAELKKLFKEHNIEKKYLALVYGKLKDKKGIIEKPIARASSYRKQVIAGRKTKTKIREAVTEYKVIKKYQNYSLVEAMPKTGRMHQIRIHLFSIGHPVVGDKLYALKKYKKIEAERQLLHAKKLSFELLGKKYNFQSGLPEDFCGMLKHLD